MVVAIAALVAVGCSRTKRTPWRPALARVFDNTSVQPSEPQRKYWNARDEDLFQRRIGHADYAAIGSVRVVNVYSTFHSAKRVALVFEPRERLHGDRSAFTDGDGALRLPIERGELDFQVALNVEGRLAGRSYLLFLKEVPSKNKAKPPPGWEGSLWRPPRKLPSFRFALYAPDSSLLEQARAMYRWLEKKK